MPEIPILQNVYEDVPKIDRSTIPENEMPPFLHVMTLLGEFGLYERNFLTAVFLYDYCQQSAGEISDFAKLENSLWTISAWQMMAARDGALTIYHFSSAIEGLKNSLRFCPTLNTKVNNRAIREAGRLFNGFFPDSKLIRDAVAHVADLSKTQESKLLNAVKGAFRKGRFSSNDAEGTTWLRGNMNERSFAVTIRGKAYTYNLNHENAARLSDVKKNIFSAFDAATIKSPSV